MIEVECGGEGLFRDLQQRDAFGQWKREMWKGIFRDVQQETRSRVYLY